ncbi:MAG: trigger factor [Cycloclasticus sp.]|nr:trigger factor [Cycloclasticus sp.]MBG97179.1 trigger factor [Cycloclasticus sp.]HAI95862.1 trigger factor [Methylococcaceae bacterium]
MQVSVESNSDIKKTLTIVVPQEEVDMAINKRYDDVKRNARIDGFRPGKVPMSVIKKKFGASVRAEALSELTQSFFYKAIMEEKMNPVSPPVITPTEKETEGYEFTASFEVYPEITVNAVEELALNKPVAELAESDIDAMVEKLQKQKATWSEVKRKAKNDDQVTVSFEGKVGDKPISEEPIKDFPVVLGSKSMIPGFEDELKGVKAGDNISFEVTFPDDYQQADFAGKVGAFDVEVIKVEKSELPEVNEEFIKEFGVKSGEMADFRADLTKNMTAELDRTLATKRKQIVMDAIVENNDVSVPEALVDNEINQMIASLNEKAAQAGQPAQPELPKELFADQATKRVKLGLLLSEVIKQNDLKTDDEKVQQRIEDFAQTYESPEEVINWYASNPEERKKVESVVLEDQLVDWVLEKANVTETSLSFEELMSSAQAAG